MQWAADYYDSSEPTTNAPRLYTHDLDLNHDGTPELLVRSHWHTWHASAAYLVFERVGARYRFIGSIGMGIYRVLPLGNDGLPRLAVYTRRTTGEGGLAIFANDGTEFIVVSSEVIHTDDGGAGERRFRELFGQDTYHLGRKHEMSNN